MIYITGDKHRDFLPIVKFCDKFKTTPKDILIILGDVGINYYTGIKDEELKEELSKLPITLFCIHGNHEERPENIKSYIKGEKYNGNLYYEEKYPNILFAIDGEIYNLNNKSVLVIGGAYSIDKTFRLIHGYNWYPSEQPSEKIKNKVIETLKKCNNKVDIVLSHTCPLEHIPHEAFLPGINQSNVDNSTEKFLDKIEKSIEYDKWYCGHYHIEKTDDKLIFMYNDIKEFK